MKQPLKILGRARRADKLVRVRVLVLRKFSAEPGAAPSRRTRRPAHHDSAEQQVRFLHWVGHP